MYPECGFEEGYCFPTHRVRARRFDAAGAPLGGEIPVSRIPAASLPAGPDPRSPPTPAAALPLLVEHCSGTRRAALRRRRRRAGCEIPVNRDLPGFSLAVRARRALADSGGGFTVVWAEVGRLRVGASIPPVLRWATRPLLVHAGVPRHRPTGPISSLTGLAASRRLAERRTARPAASTRGASSTPRPRDPDRFRPLGLTNDPTPTFAFSSDEQAQASSAASTAAATRPAARRRHRPAR